MFMHRRSCKLYPLTWVGEEIIKAPLGLMAKTWVGEEIIKAPLGLMAKLYYVSFL